MPLRRIPRVPLTLATLVVLAACSTDSAVSPTEVSVREDGPDALLAQLAASPELSALGSPATQRLVDQAERLIRGEPRAYGPGNPPLGMAEVASSVPPVDSTLTPPVIAALVFQVTVLLYERGYFADATGNPRPDRALAIIHPAHYAAVGVAANDSAQAVAGLEAAIEWYEQRSAEGLIPNDIAQWLIGYADVAIDKLGGPNATKTLCLDADERSCVTAELTSIRWLLTSLQTRLRHDFSYAFLDGEPPQIEVLFRLATGAPNCNIVGAPIETSSDSIWTVSVRREPSLTANPNDGGFTNFNCVPHGVIRGFRWDGLVVRDEEGLVLASCGVSSGSPCHEPAE